MREDEIPIFNQDCIYKLPLHEILSQQTSTNFFWERKWHIVWTKLFLWKLRTNFFICFPIVMARGQETINFLCGLIKVYYHSCSTHFYLQTNFILIVIPLWFHCWCTLNLEKSPVNYVYLWNTDIILHPYIQYQRVMIKVKASTNILLSCIEKWNTYKKNYSNLNQRMPLHNIRILHKFFV